jgi:hypothetical protein
MIVSSEDNQDSIRKGTELPKLSKWLPLSIFSVKNTALGVFEAGYWRRSFKISV